MPNTLYRLTWTDDKGWHEHLEPGYSALGILDKYREEMDNHHVTYISIVENGPREEGGEEGGA